MITAKIIADHPDNEIRKNLIQQIKSVCLDYVDSVDIFDPDQIVLETAHEYISRLKKFDLIVAELSLEKASCYYELALAETSGVALIVMAHESARFHQMGSENNSFQYVSDQQMIAELHQRIKAFRINEGSNS
jgi:hypothetical protein